MNRQHLKKQIVLRLWIGLLWVIELLAFSLFSIASPFISFPMLVVLVPWVLLPIWTIFLFDTLWLIFLKYNLFRRIIWIIVGYLALGIITFFLFSGVEYPDGVNPLKAKWYYLTPLLVPAAFYVYEAARGVRYLVRLGQKAGSRAKHEMGKKVSFMDACYDKEK